MHIVYVLSGEKKKKKRLPPLGFFAGGDDGVFFGGGVNKNIWLISAAQSTFSLPLEQKTTGGDPERVAILSPPVRKLVGQI